MKLKSVLSIVFVSSIILVLLTGMSVFEKWEVPEEYKTMKNPFVGQPDPDGIGADLWKTHCASCHGKTGNGDGKKADELESELDDFAEEEVQAQSDGVLFYKSFIGRDEMPNFEKKITDNEDRWMLINYIRQFAE